MKPWLPILSLAALLCPAAGPAAAEVGLIKIDGAIGPATANYIARAIDVCRRARHDACLVIQLDTPGGLLDSTKDIVQTFYASHVPVVVYVAPSGANAGSAGCFITLAADVAAMAPNTSIGAAHPVSIGAGGERKDRRRHEAEAGEFRHAATSRPSPTNAAATSNGPNPPSSRARPSPPKRRSNSRSSTSSPRTCRTCCTQLDGREVGGTTPRTPRAPKSWTSR